MDRMELLAPIAMLMCLGGGLASIPALIGVAVVLRGRAEGLTRAAWERAAAELGLSCVIHGFDDVHLSGMRRGRSFDVRCGAMMNRRGVMVLETRVTLALTERASRPADALELLRKESAAFAVLGGGLGAGLAPAPHLGARIEDGQLVVSVPRVWRDAEPLIAFLLRVERLADALDGG